MGSGQNQTRKVVFASVACLIALIAVLFTVYYLTKEDDHSNETSIQRAHRVLQRQPIFDGHNDFPFNLRIYTYNDLRKVNFSSDLTKVEPWASANNSHTDIPRLKIGHIGAQFWAAFTPCSSQYRDSVEQTIEQIDVIHRLVDAYSEHLQWAESSQDIKNAVTNNKIASLIGVEGGHSVQSSFGVLRVMYKMGVRYMTLTHTCNTPWADSSPVDDNLLEPQSGGLSLFGLKMVNEMNRLGMMIDLSHVSVATMKAALRSSKAPAIFSHSSAKAICNHHRNVPDDVLDLVKETNSLVMVNFYPSFIQCNASKYATIDDVIEHLNHIKNRTSADNVGLGADYDGVRMMPTGLEDVSKYPDLFAKLIETGLWSDEELEKLAGKNLLRVFEKTEQVRDSMKNESPNQDSITQMELTNHGVNQSCISASFPP